MNNLAAFNATFHFTPSALEVRPSCKDKQPVSWTEPSPTRDGRGVPVTHLCPNLGYVAPYAVWPSNQLFIITLATNPTGCHCIPLRFVPHPPPPHQHPRWGGGQGPCCEPCVTLTVIVHHYPGVITMDGAVVAEMRFPWNCHPRNRQRIRPKLSHGAVCWHRCRMVQIAHYDFYWRYYFRHYSSFRRL